MRCTHNNNNNKRGNRYDMNKKKTIDIILKLRFLNPRLVGRRRRKE